MIIRTSVASLDQPASYQRAPIARTSTRKACVVAVGGSSVCVQVLNLLQTTSESGLSLIHFNAPLAIYYTFVYLYWMTITGINPRRASAARVTVVVSCVCVCVSVCMSVRTRYSGSTRN